MITTVAAYCKERGVSRQFVYEYIKKGKFKLYETPKYIKVRDKYIEVGKEKVLETAPLDDKERARFYAMLKEIGISDTLLAHYKHIDTLTEPEQSEYITNYRSTLSPTELAEYDKQQKDLVGRFIEKNDRDLAEIRRMIEENQ